MIGVMSAVNELLDTVVVVATGLLSFPKNPCTYVSTDYVAAMKANCTQRLVASCFRCPGRRNFRETGVRTLTFGVGDVRIPHFRKKRMKEWIIFD